MVEKLAEEVGVSKDEVMMGCILFARIAKAMADTERVGEFKIHVCDNDCKVYILTTWGAEINAYALRPQWMLAVTKALDELDEIKPETIPSTDNKE